MPKPRLRHWVYFFGAVAVLLNAKQPVCALRPCDWLVPFLLLFIILLPLELYFLISRSYRIKSHLDQGDPQKFLDETRKELAAVPGGTWKDFYKLNSTAGLYYLGRFEEALKILDEVRPRKLHKQYTALYFNNKLANLLGVGRVQEAAQLVEEQADIFRPNRHNQRFYFALQANLGALKYHQGELEVARHMLEESLAAHRLPLASAVSHYYLGCIAHDQGREDDAAVHFAHARELGERTFVAERLA
ncbi:MAG: tetratricopeptide repeat protein [Candidatus Omnitrophica bacterium]|nr:tetratricopeptide repeat protein [Candidatus Omnitrophota bacterium]